MKTIRFLPDQPIEDWQKEALGFQKFVELIQRSIYHTDTPFVYGVLGDWGAGKTTILNLLAGRLAVGLEQRLDPKPFIPIWFNAWKYENEANLVYPLLDAIRRDYERRGFGSDSGGAFGQKFLKVVTASTLALVNVGMRVATKQLAGEAIGLEDVQKQVAAADEHEPSDRLEKVLRYWADQIRELEGAFQDLLDLYAKDYARCFSPLDAKDIRFVILIDDLDRCLPETTITILEGIKNYLMATRCIFVLGLNPKVIYQGIRIKYHGLEIDGREYLEKILNYSFYVPEPEAEKLVAYAIGSLEDRLPIAEERRVYEGYFRQFGQVLRDCKFHNPRKIRRILNHFLIFLGNYEDRLADYDLANIIRYILMAEYFPALFQLFLEDAGTVQGLIGRLVGLQANTGQLSAEDFEKQFNVAIKADMARLIQMKTLFDLHSQNNIHLPQLAEQAQAVYRITHLT